jgi:hypothetical protein
MGKSLTFWDADMDDAAFILSVGTDGKKSQYLNALSTDICDQQGWLYCYASATDPSYFMIDCQDEPIRTVRLCDVQEDSFCLE